MKSGEPMTKSSFRRFWYNILDKMNVAAGGDEFFTFGHGYTINRKRRYTSHIPSYICD